MRCNASAIGRPPVAASKFIRVTVLRTPNGSLHAQGPRLSSSSGEHRHRFRHSLSRPRCHLDGWLTALNANAKMVVPLRSTCPPCLALFGRHVNC